MGSNNGGEEGDFYISKKTMEMIERVKEIVKNTSDDEIYDMLLECNMNPDDAVQKLLLQDDFLEVKSKRERKKENKEASEFHSQYLSTSSRTLGHGGSSQYYFTDSEASGGKSTYKEENRSNPLSGSLTSTSSKEVPRSLSNPVTQRQIWQRVDVNKCTQPLAGSQSACVGVSSPLTMADIVKIGKVNDNVSRIPIGSTGMSCSPHDAVASNACKNVENPPLRAFLQDDLILELGCSEDPVLENSEKICEAGIASSKHVHNHRWQSPAASGSSILEPSITSEVSTDPSSLSNLHTRIANLHLGSQSDDVQAPPISFGSYRPFASKPSITDFKEIPLSGSASSDGQLITRSLVSSTTENGAVERSSSLYSQLDAAPGHHYTYCPDSTLERGTLLNAAQAYSQQTYSNLLPTNLWASARIQPSSDPEYMSTKKLQSLATLSSIHSLPTISIPERVNRGVFPMSELNLQPSSGNYADADSLSSRTNAYSDSQQRVNPGVFSISELNQQANLSSGNFADAVGYSYSHGTNAYIPSASQQRAMANNYTYQSPAAIGDTGRMHTLSQLRNSVPVSSLPHSAAIGSGYGGFGSSADISEILKLNPNAMPTHTAIDDFYSLTSQHNNNGSSFGPVSQNGGSVRRVSEPGLRTMPSLSAQQYQNSQGPNTQLRWELQQVQEYLQKYGEGYPNLRHSQIGTRNLQEQILMDKTSDNSLQQYRNFQGLNPQLRWDSQQVEEHSQQYGAQGYPTLHHSQIGSRNLQEQILMDRNLQEQILMDRISDNSGQQYQNLQGLNPQLRWDSQQFKELSQPYGAQGYPNLHHSQIGAQNREEQILMDRTSDSSLQYSIPQHSSTGASHDYQNPIAGDSLLGSSAWYPNLQHAQMGSFQKKNP
ncbi:hypothetical protein AQUCO_05700057v1 [Aquilegia coerulea]|uniref:GBF-interacting protein 1 N-terminal domain-containing protein n=1 Tax=Aquilegia coerulea TaxID=218851 RepID=A0A2G5CFJ7_AQUCA|nr:hypothetical protein AQUCO_05700057v1 [Aquilegia coerulea]